MMLIVEYYNISHLCNLGWFSCIFGFFVLLSLIRCCCFLFFVKYNCSVQMKQLLVSV